MNDVAPLAWLAAGALALSLFVAVRARRATQGHTAAGRAAPWSPFEPAVLVTIGALHLAVLASAATWLDPRTVAVALLTELVALVVLTVAAPWHEQPPGTGPRARGESPTLGSLGIAASLTSWLSIVVGTALALPAAFSEATTSLEPALAPWLVGVLLVTMATPFLLARSLAISALVERLALPAFAGMTCFVVIALVVTPLAEDGSTGSAILRDALARAWWATDARADGLPNAAFAAGVVSGAGLAWISTYLAGAVFRTFAAPALTGQGAPSTTRRLLTQLASWTAGCLAATTVIGASTVSRESFAIFDPVLDREVVGAHHLEIPIARAHAPSTTLGQTIVLADDAGLTEGARHPVVYRADPRGAKIGLVEPKLNRVRVAADALTREVEWISFRSRERIAGAMPSFDLRIPVRATVRRGTILPPTTGPAATGSEDERTPPTPVEISVVTLEPEIDVDLDELAARLDGPYVHLPDARYVVTVTRTRSVALGEHLTAYVDEADRGDMPPLRRVVSEMRYRGPYLDSGETRAPLAMVVPESFPGRNGDVVSLRHEGPERGLAIGLLRGTVEDGELLLPAWPELAAAREVILRHREDARLDRRIPIEVAMGDDGLLHARSASPEVLRLVDAPRMKDYDGPFLAVPPTTRRYELRGDARLPSSLAGNRALIPLDAPIEIQGRRGELRAPHFMELEQAGFAPPHLAFDGMGRVGRVLCSSFGNEVAALFLASAGMMIGLVLGLVALALGRDVSARLAPAAGGVGLEVSGSSLPTRAPGVGLAVVLLAAVAAGPGLGLRGDAALLAAASVGVLAWTAWLVRRILGVRAAS